jgi:hypothetical protein
MDNLPDGSNSVNNETILPLRTRLGTAQTDLRQALNRVESKTNALTDRAVSGRALLNALDTQFSSLGLPPLIRRGIEIHLERLIEECETATAALELIGGDE